VSHPVRNSGEKKLEEESLEIENSEIAERQSDNHFDNGYPENTFSEDRGKKIEEKSEDRKQAEEEFIVPEGLSEKLLQEKLRNEDTRQDKIEKILDKKIGQFLDSIKDKIFDHPEREYNQNSGPNYNPQPPAAVPSRDREKPGFSAYPSMQEMPATPFDNELIIDNEEDKINKLLETNSSSEIQKIQFLKESVAVLGKYFNKNLDSLDPEKKIDIIANEKYKKLLKYIKNS